MKNTKEVQAILTAIYVLNRTSEHTDTKIESILEYAFHRCFDANTNLLLLATLGKSRLSMEREVDAMLEIETKYCDLPFSQTLADKKENRR